MLFFPPSKLPTKERLVLWVALTAPQKKIFSNSINVSNCNDAKKIQTNARMKMHL
jgi:hypothetical protein